MRLSIIIPIYRVEETLQRCLESIAGQTFTQWEAILVDDGSPDQCPVICDQWARNDPRFVVVHKANGGLSDARNAGIGMARGDYLTFADPDDYVEKDTYRKLAAVLDDHPDYDIVEYPFIRQWPDGRREPMHLTGRVYHEPRSYWLDEQAYSHAYAWNKIYKRHLFGSVRYPVGKVFEDVHILPQLLSEATTIATTNVGCYYYVQNAHGITAQAHGKEWTSLLEAQIKAAESLSLFEPPLTSGATLLYMHLLDIQLLTHALTGVVPALPDIRIESTKSGMPFNRRVKLLLLKTVGLNSLCAVYRLFYQLGGKHILQH